MSDRVVLPSGAWVDLRDPATISERQCRPVRAAMLRLSAGARTAIAATNSGDTAGFVDAMEPGDMDVMWAVNDLVAAGMISDASFGVAPFTADTVGDLSRADYDALITATSPFAGAFFGVDFDTAPAADARTADNPT